MFFVSILPTTLATDVTSACRTQEALVLSAAKHVMMAQKQRELFNMKKHHAYVSRLAEKEKDQSIFTFVADYAQNMYLPSFQGAQPGETYYYSPVNAYCFGVVDASLRPS
jgi:hypothetical protein